MSAMIYVVPYNSRPNINMKRYKSGAEISALLKCYRTDGLREVCASETEGFHEDKPWQHVMVDIKGEIGSPFDLWTNAKGYNKDTLYVDACLQVRLKSQKCMSALHLWDVKRMDARSMLCRVAPHIVWSTVEEANSARWRGVQCLLSATPRVVQHIG
jgi:hypothetical protein